MSLSAGQKISTHSRSSEEEYTPSDCFAMIIHPYVYQGVRGIPVCMYERREKTMTLHYVHTVLSTYQFGDYRLQY